MDDDPANVAAVKRGPAILADNAAAEILDTDVRHHVVVRVALSDRQYWQTRLDEEAR